MSAHLFVMSDLVVISHSILSDERGEENAGETFANRNYYAACYT